jgi:hypothetical protein
MFPIIKNQNQWNQSKREGTREWKGELKRGRDKQGIKENNRRNGCDQNTLYTCMEI